ncbi:MAG: RNA methyltransferase [Gemmatimonadaceae bacterium]|nr:RNA methyltransferase [Gemmatimonadaceae bacterium]
MRILTRARDLSRRKARDRDGLFVAEGVRAVEELLASPLTIDGVLCAPQLMDAPRGARLRADLEVRGLTVSDVTEREFASAAATESPQGILAIARVPGRSLADLVDRTPLRLLVIDAVQDPGNVGTLVRTAHGLGLDGSVALPGTVDLWNAKVVRSAMGSLFRHHALSASLEELSAFLTRASCPLWCADVAGAPLEDTPAPPRLAIAVGNEGAGLTPAVRAMASRFVALPMRGDAESLNVAVAAGILLWVLQP